MNMSTLKKYFNNIWLYVVLIWGTGLLVSCKDQDTPDEPQPPLEETLSETTLLIYAVATNSLTYNLVSDKNEMLEAAASCDEIGKPLFDVEKNNILIFETQYYYNEDNVREPRINLLKMVKDEDGSFKWDIEKEFTDEVPSLQPSRISEIINYVAENYKAENYGLILWSHSTGSQPYLPTETREGLPSAYSFGQDKSESDPYIEINVDDLANQIPDHFFDYIWFDSCYMSNIESIYQFRNKCDLYVGYPTEVLDDGMPYQVVLPYLVGKQPDILAGARQFFDFYANYIATIAVIDMSKIDILSDFCNQIYNEGLEVSSYSLKKYTRYSTGPFYDFGDYTKAMAELAEIELTDDVWNAVLDECVLYKAATTRDFSYGNIDPEKYSGISTHLYSFSETDSAVETYYRSLDWYKKVFGSY